jgi:hypothetical protein
MPACENAGPIDQGDGGDNIEGVGHGREPIHFFELKFAGALRLSRRNRTWAGRGLGRPMSRKSKGTHVFSRLDVV